MAKAQEKKQRRPGSENAMKEKPKSEDLDHQASQRLLNKVVLISGGDSGIGKAVALLFAREGADIAIAYLSETKDAKEVKAEIEKKYKRKCTLYRGNLANESHCEKVVKGTLEDFGQLDILINNAAIHYEQSDITKLDSGKMRETFENNIYSMFYLTKHAVPHLKKGSCIINSSSVTAYRGSEHLLDYSATKGAIVAFTRSLANSLVKKGIRVNGVAPGPIWTPLIASSFDKKRIRAHGKKSPMGRPGEPAEVAPSYLFLAMDDNSYMSGQFLHPNGGEIING